MGILTMIRSVGVKHAKIKAGISRQRNKIEKAFKLKINNVKKELSDINKEINKERFKGLSKTEKNKILARRRYNKKKIESIKKKAKKETMAFVKRRFEIAKKNIRAESKRLRSLEKKKSTRKRKKY